jgi:glycosyltransferase involved in cell wall biosynthesis
VRITFLHPKLTFTDGTARLINTVDAAILAGHHVSVISEMGSRKDALLRTGAQVFKGELPTHPVLGHFAMGRARHQVAELEPDLLHVTHAGLAPLAARVSSALERPYILELESLPESRIPLDEEWLKKVILPCPTFLEKAFNAGQINRSLFQVIEHGPDLERDWPPRRVIENQRPVVLMIGTLDMDHGVDVLIDAVRILDKTGRRLNVLILGEGPEEDRFRRQVRELHLSEVITISSPMLPGPSTVFAQADLHVSCVRSGSPGWSAARAYGMGIPSIFSATGSTFGWVEDRQDGLLVEHGDPVKLAESIVTLLENQAAARQMGVRAREKRLESARHADFLREIAELYEAAAGQILQVQQSTKGTKTSTQVS